MRLDDTTREAERHDAQAAPSGGPHPTPEEEAAAERAAPADPEVSGNYEEYLVHRQPTGPVDAHWGSNDPVSWFQRSGCCCQTDRGAT